MQLLVSKAFSDITMSTDTSVTEINGHHPLSNGYALPGDNSRDDEVPKYVRANERAVLVEQPDPSLSIPEYVDDLESEPNASNQRNEPGKATLLDEQTGKKGEAEMMSSKSPMKKRGRGDLDEYEDGEHDEGEGENEGFEAGDDEDGGKHLQLLKTLCRNGATQPFKFSLILVCF